MSKQNPASILSHSTDVQPVEQIVSDIKARICLEGDKSHVSVKQQLAYLEQLTEFEFGRFLLKLPFESR